MHKASQGIYFSLFCRFFRKREMQKLIEAIRKKCIFLRNEQNFNTLKQK